MAKANQCIIIVIFIDDLSSLPEANKSTVPFIACGDLSQFDSDMTYPLEEVSHILLHIIRTFMIFLLIFIYFSIFLHAISGFQSPSSARSH